jgi:hypothetical protein
MNKDQIFKAIRDGVSQNVVSVPEVTAFANGLTAGSGSSTESESKSSKDSLVPKVLYVIGGIIALSGILVLLGNNWDAIGFAGRWLVTVGLGLVLFISAFILHKKKDFDVLSQVFFFVSAATLFIGGYVWIGESALGFWDGADSSLLVGSLLFLVFGFALYVSKKSILHIVATFFFTIAYYAMVFKLLKGTGFDAYVLKDITVYASMILALAYLMYGSWIQKTGFTDQTGIMARFLPRLYTFCAFSLFLFSGLFLGGIWNLIYAFLAIGSVILSLRLQTKIGLFVTSCAIGVYCIKISLEYFADSISFSLALLFAGLLIIALGYLTYYLNKKYITKT